MEDPPKTRRESKKDPRHKRADYYSTKHVRLVQARNDKKPPQSPNGK